MTAGPGKRERASLTWRERVLVRVLLGGLGLLVLGVSAVSMVVAREQVAGLERMRALQDAVVVAPTAREVAAALQQRQHGRGYRT